jgi:AAA family ATP:ADP antiporter
VGASGILSELSNVRREEAAATLVSGFLFFCVLAALMVVRPAREALGMQRGIEQVRWLFVGTVVVTLLVNPLFGLLVSRLRRFAFVAATYSFFAGGLAAFYALLVLAPESVGVRTGQVFYVWFSVFNLFATMLFWALMADRFSLEQSKRLFGVIAVGGTLGALFGPWLASVLARPLGTPALLLVAAGLLLVALAAAAFLVRLRLPASRGEEGETSDRGPELERVPIGGSAWEGFHAVARSPYLLAICGYVLILAVIVTFLYFTRLQMVAALGTGLDARTATFARIDMITQAATLLFQAVVAGHLMKRIGVSATLALLPVTAALGFVGLAIAGSLAALVAFEASFRAVQRGIMRPARETLFTVVSRADRYKAKAFIDTFVYRTGDVLGAQLEGLLGRLGAGLAALVSFALPLALAWMALGLWLGHAQRERAAHAARPRTAAAVS